MHPSSSHGTTQYNFKIVLLGEGRVGKTSILLRYVHDSYTDGIQSTLQASYLDKRIVIPPSPNFTKHRNSNLDVNLSIWDTAGQERFHALGPIYYRDANGAVLVYDITDAESFLRVKTWTMELRKIVGDIIAIVIVGNKIDLERDRCVDEDAVLAFANSVGALHFRTSAKTNQGLNEVFQQLTLKMVDDLGSNNRKKNGGTKHKTLSNLATAGYAADRPGGPSTVGGRQQFIILTEDDAPELNKSSCC